MRHLTVLPILLIAPLASAAPTAEWASSVVGFSDQYSSGRWSAAQALGTPDTKVYGDVDTAWTTYAQNNGIQYLSLGFSTATYSTGALIRETYGNGFVTQIDAIDVNGAYHPVWTGTDSSLPGTPVDFMPTWSQTSFLTKGLKIYVNTNHSPSWEEIDAVRLDGNTVYGTPPVQATPEPFTMGLGVAGVGLALRRRLRRA